MIISEDGAVQGKNKIKNSNEGKIECVNPKWGFVRVPRGYSLVTEGLTGKLKSKNSGLRFAWPWERRTFIPITDTPIDLKKEEYRSREDYLVVVDTAVTYKITDPSKFYVEENAKTQLQLTMSSILRRLVSKYNYQELSEVSIILDQHNPEFNWIETELNLFELKYGVKVDKITIQKAELTGELKKAQEENAVSKEVNKRNIAKATADKTVAEKEAETMIIRGEADAQILAKRLSELSIQLSKMNLSNTEKTQILREIFRSDNSNLTVIENNTGNEAYNVGAVCASMGRQNSQDTQEQIPIKAQVRKVRK